LKYRKLIIACLTAWSLATAVHAEDIDLFADAPPAGNDLPNVLFIIDNTANWNSAFTNEMSAIYNVLANLPDDRFNIGIMLATETGSPNNNTSGGYVRAAIRPMTAANKLLYANFVASLDQIGDKGNGGKSALSMVEAYRYFAGGAPVAGNGKVKTDYTGNTYGSTASQAIYALGDNALDSMNATTYNSPQGNGCNKNFIIYISNGPNQESNSVDAEANLYLNQAGGSTTQLTLSPTGSQTNPSDEWSRFMKDELDITTYTIDVNPPSSGQGPGWSALLRSMANVSRGEYFSVTSGSGGADISGALSGVLSEIQAVNSVFSSVSLPLSVNSQGTYLNQVYVGLFRPQANALPVWNGNLKQFKLGRDSSGSLKLMDADSDPAISTTSGFIDECARSYWTPSATDTYWTFRPESACIPPAPLAADTYQNSNFPDGNVVEKGGQGYRRRVSTTRNMKTCSRTFASCDDSSNSLTNFEVANGDITATSLGFPTATSSERDSLVQWAMGLDVADENSNGVTTGEMRPSIHGDVVHSRPVALNLGTATNPKVVVFYGGNDGVLRAINGNRPDNNASPNIGSAVPGDELWAFMPPEFFSNVKRLRDNEVQISLPYVVPLPTAPTPLPKPYGIDGPISAIQANVSDVWLNTAMRRGGRAVYSFNVPVSNPANIALKWKKGCPNNFTTLGTVSDVDCSTGFEDIGQTWSAAKPITAAGYTGNLLIMGGGYDPCEDADPHTCTNTSKGRKVYVLEADTGNIQRSFTTEHPVVADIAIAPDLATGNALYAYVVDLGGNVYRIDIGSAAIGSWGWTKIASLGCASTASCTRPRKFMFAPDIAYEGGTYLLLMGSGDREKPLNNTNTVDNYFFMVRDNPSSATWLSSEATNCGGVSVLCMDSLTQIAADAADPSAADIAAKKGWALAMHPTEQVVTAAITIFGTVTFSSHEPVVATPGVCDSNLGTARVYNISYLNAAAESGARFAILPDEFGLPPSPVAGMVTLDDGTSVPFCIGCNPVSPLESEEPTIPPSSTPVLPKSRVYWYIQR
jgi:type IV pilus assembly protein PilY1